MVISLIAGLLALGQTASSPAQAQSTVPPGFETLRPTEELTGPAINGNITGDTSGAKVFIYAVPVIAENATTSPHPVPAGIAEVSGASFRIIPDPSVDLRRFVNDSGVVDFEVVAGTDEHVGMFYMSRHLDNEGRIIPSNTGPLWEADDDGSVTRVSNPDAIVIDIKHRLQRGNYTPSEQCQVSYKKVNTQIGSGYHRVGGVRLLLTYRRGSDSTLGAAINVGGQGWELNGSAERSTGDEAGTQWDTIKEQDQFHYTKFRYKIEHCDWVWMNGWGYWRVIRAKPNNYAGGNASGRPRFYPVTPFDYCDKYYPEGSGFEYVRKSSKAVRYKKGVRLGFINVGSQSGFNEETAIYGDVKYGRYLCGWTGDVGHAPGLVVVGRPS